MNINPKHPVAKDNGRDPFVMTRADILSRHKKSAPPVVVCEPGATISVEAFNVIAGQTIVTARLNNTDCRIQLGNGKAISLSMCGKRGLVVEIVDSPLPPVARRMPKRPDAASPNSALLGGLGALEKGTVLPDV